MSVSKKELFAKNFASLSGAGVTLAEFMKLSASEAESLVASLDSTESLDLEGDTSEPEQDQVYLNLELEIGGKLHRITGVRLDSDFVQYMDKEHTKENKLAMSLLKTIRNKGAAYCNEHAKFNVSVQVQGESNITVTDELF